MTEGITYVIEYSTLSLGTYSVNICLANVYLLLQMLDAEDIYRLSGRVLQGDRHCLIEKCDSLHCLLPPETWTRARKVALFILSMMRGDALEGA